MSGCGVTCDPRNDECRCVPCRMCDGRGQWEAACCNGAGGCSCRGDFVPMGTCRVCHGYGQHAPDADTTANVKAIQGFCFIGTGGSDSYGLWPAHTRMGLPGVSR